MARGLKSIKGGDFVAQEPLTGAYPARVVQYIELGLQEQRPYKGEPKKPSDEAYITYELVDEFMLDKDGKEIEDKPRWLSERIPLRSLMAENAKSTKRYEALDPDGALDGQLSMCVEVPCTVTATTNESGGKVYTNVASVAPMRAKDAGRCPELVNPAKVFLIDEPDMDIFHSIPEWLQTVIKEAIDFPGSKLEELLGESNGSNAESNEADEEEETNEEEW